MKYIYSVVILALFSQPILAQCMVHYEREACVGKARNGKTNEVMSYKKCGGKKSCTKEKTASTLAECQAAALKACGNRRFTVTKSKVITAKWNGQAIKDQHGNADFCLKYEKRDEEFFRCAK